MVQSLGISVGNQNCYLAAGAGGGIDILLNEYSQRSTPTMVAFNKESRNIGVDAATNYFINLKNTVNNVMILLGKTYKQITSLGNHPFDLEEGPNGEALVVVKHLGKDRKFTPTQILAMLFTKLREVAAYSNDCVISHPQFFDDIQKVELVRAAKIAGLNPLQVISDMSAVIINYAYYRTTKEDPRRLIAFVDFGQSNLQCAIALLTPKDDTVMMVAAESLPIGGRDFDRRMADHFVEKNKLNLPMKSYLKLVAACEKVKKNLSANSDVPIHVESLISDEKDFSDRIDRATFEQFCEDIFEKVGICLRNALENAKQNFAASEIPDSEFNIQAVEIVGGSTRIPAIRKVVQTTFDLVPSTTLNTDEAVARGCVLHCATLHPGVKVKRDVKILGSEYSFDTDKVVCDVEARKIEQELIEFDARYRSRLEARNNLEEFIYNERSKLQEGDEFLSRLSSNLDWLEGEEADEAPEEEYNVRLLELRKFIEARYAAQRKIQEEAENKKKAELEAKKKQEAEKKKQEEAVKKSQQQQQPQQEPPQNNEETKMEVNGDSNNKEE